MRNVKPETWSLTRALVFNVAWVLPAVVGGLVACQRATPAPPPPTLTATPCPATAPVPSPTPMTEAPSPSPTEAPQGGAATLASTRFLSPTATLIRGPYLQSVTADSIVVAWETDRPSHGEIAYGETEAYGWRATDPAVRTRHAVTLTGLAPYTAYHYRVESGGAPLSEGATFRTAAGPGQTQFTFVVFGDTRTQHRVHRAVADQIVALDPDFLLHTGDLVAHGHSAGEWGSFFEIEQELMAHAPLFPVLGNHEGNSRLYFDLFYLPGNERWYTFDYGNARFVCLQVDGSARFTPHSEQYAWLEETLATNVQPWLFVGFHVPPYTSVYDRLEGNVRRTLTPLFERYGVDVVLNGHKHNYERNEVNGITYVVTAGGGAPLYAMQEREPTQAAFALAHHFVLLEIDGHHLRAMAISSAGEVLDEFERSAD
jgi:predicted phosphodiesterase